MHATRKLVVVTVKANQLTRAVAVLVPKGVTVTCCGTSATAKKTIRIR